MPYPEPVNFLNLANWFASVLGVSEPVGEIFASLFVAGIFLIICFFLKSQIVIVISIGILVLVPLTAIGWIPVYTWIVIGIYVASSVARNWKEIF
jgi:hypothetical protein